jgi:PQQ-dependent dehydrogenase (methanol/ethanol family)
MCLFFPFIEIAFRLKTVRKGYAVIFLASLATVTTAVANDELLKKQADPHSWLMPGGDYENTRFRKLDAINRETAGQLQIAWSQSTGTLRGHEGAPLVVGGVLYVHTPYPNNVIAFDLDTHAALWSYEPMQDANVVPLMPVDTVSRGLAYGDGKIFLQRADTKLVALDALTGNTVLSVDVGNPRIGQTSTNAPMVVKDKVITGISSGDFGVRGYLSAYSTRDGHLIWRAYSTGPDKETLFDPERTRSLGAPVGAQSSTSTWQGEQWQHGGGATWGWYSWDSQTNLIYYGTGNPAPQNAALRSGDNRWTAAVIARDADTGIAKWAYQFTPHDEWDFDGTNEMILVDLNIDGKPRKALVHFDHNGFVYIFDRITGDLLRADKFDPFVNWATRVEPTTGRPVRDPRYSANQLEGHTKNICPASRGAKNFSPVAYNPLTRLFYVSVNYECMDYETQDTQYTAGQPYIGASSTFYSAGRVTHSNEKFNAKVIAWDAEHQRVVWSIPQENHGAYGGIITTSGEVIIHGTVEGQLQVRNALTGDLLVSYQTGSGIVGHPIVFEHNGEEFIAVLSGVGGWAGASLALGKNLKDPLWSKTRLGGEVTVFRLVGDPFGGLKWLIHGARSHPMPLSIAGAGLLLLVLWSSLYWLYPLGLLRIHAVVARFEVKIPHIETRLSLSYVLLLYPFQRSDRALDAWVAEHMKSVRGIFANLETVRQRAVHLELPFTAEGAGLAQTIEVTSNSQLVNRIFSKQIVIVLITAEGGSGKTSLACHLAKASMSIDAGERLTAHCAIPVLLEEEVVGAAGKRHEELTRAIGRRVELLTQSSRPIRRDLLLSLLRRRRILLIVDRFSEWSSKGRNMIRPGRGGFPVAALIITSRFDETLEGIPKVTFRPNRVKGDVLFEFMRQYFVERGVRGKFTDEEFFAGCARLAAVVHEKPITPLFAKIYADLLIGNKMKLGSPGEVDEDNAEDAPKSLPDLVVSYIRTINKGRNANDPDDGHVLADIKTIAWRCVGATLAPGKASVEDVLRVLGGPNAEARLEYLDARLRLIRKVGPQADTIRFGLDPLAEYLAAMYVASQYGSDIAAWRSLIARATQVQDPQAIAGFVSALEDVCVNATGQIPLEVVGEVRVLLGRDVKNRQGLPEH